MEEPQQYLTCTAADGSLTVRLTESAVQRLNVEIMKGFGVTRRRGIETGGLLLGRTLHGSPPVMIVEDFEVVPCEYAYGPSYILSPNDQPQFDETVARRQADAEAPDRVVGYFRSHTRDGLGVDSADEDLFSRLPRETARIVLVVKPFATRTALARLFVATAGRLRSSQPECEFPFDVEEANRRAPTVPPAAPLPPLSKPDSPAATVPSPAVSEPSVSTAARVVAEPPAAPAAERAAREWTEEERLLTNVLGPRRNPASPSETTAASPVIPAAEGRSARTPVLTACLALAFVTAALTLGYLAGFQSAGGRLRLESGPALQRPATSQLFDLGLRVTRAGEKVQAEWSASSEAVQKGESGTLTIEEAGMPPRVHQMEPAELRGGIILFPVRSGSARVRLDVDLSGGRRASQTVEWP